MVAADDVGAHVAQDAVEQEPRDLLARVGGHVDEDGDVVEAVFEGVGGDGCEWIALEPCADALARAAETEGYGWFGDGRAEEVVGEDDVAVV